MAEVDRSKIDPRLVALVEVVERKTRCKLICGHRGKEEQDKAYALGNSKLKFPMSKHNTIPSTAIDFIPLPVDWKNIDRFKSFCETVKAEAKILGINLVSAGLEWKFKDYPHFELKE